MQENILLSDEIPIKDCHIIFIHWTFNFVCFVGRAIHEFKIPTKYNSI